MNAKIRKGLNKLLARRPGRTADRAAKFMSLLFEHLKEGQLPLVETLSDKATLETLDLVEEYAGETVAAVQYFPGHELSTELGEVTWTELFGHTFASCFTRYQELNRDPGGLGSFRDSYDGRVQAEIEELLQPLKLALQVAVNAALDQQAEPVRLQAVSQAAVSCVWRAVVAYLVAVIAGHASTTKQLEKLARAVIRQPIIGFTWDRQSVLVLIK